MTTSDLSYNKLIIITKAENPNFRHDKNRFDIHYIGKNRFIK